MRLVRIKSYSSKNLFFILVLALTLVGGFLRIWRADLPDFSNDEFLGLSAARTFLENGTFYKWDWLQNKSGEFTECVKIDRYCNYTRAWPHTLLIALAIAFGGVSELVARIPSLVFGIITIPLTAWITFKISGSKIAGLFAGLVMAFDYEMVQYSRTVRMYALLIPVFSLLVYYLRPSRLVEVSAAGLRDKFLFGLGAVLLLLTSYLLHLNTLILFPALAAYTAVVAVMYRNKTAVYLLFSGLAAAALVVLLALSNIIPAAIFKMISITPVYNFEYVRIMLGYPFPVLAAVLLIFAAGFAAWKDTRKRLDYLYTSILVFVSLVFFTLFADRYVIKRYIAHVVPFAYLLIGWGISAVWHFIKTDKILAGFKQRTHILAALSLLGTTIVLYMVVKPFLIRASKLYDPRVVRPRTVETYSMIRLDDSLNEAILANIPRTYYMTDFVKRADILRMDEHKGYTVDKLKKDIAPYDRVWISWETSKIKKHIDESVLEYVCKNFTQVSGEGCGKVVTTSGVELFYFENKKAE